MYGVQPCSRDKTTRPVTYAPTGGQPKQGQQGQQGHTVTKRNKRNAGTTRRHCMRRTGAVGKQERISPTCWCPVRIFGRSRMFQRPVREGLFFFVFALWAAGSGQPRPSCRPVPLFTNGSKCRCLLSKESKPHIMGQRIRGMDIGRGEPTEGPFCNTVLRTSYSKKIDKSGGWRCTPNIEMQE